MDLSPLMKLGVTNITISVDFTDRSGVQAISELLDRLKADTPDTPAAPETSSDEPLFYIFDHNSRLYYRKRYCGLTTDLRQAHKYSKSEVDLIGDVTAIPASLLDGVRHLLDNDVKGFKNGYKAVRDAFEADATVCTNDLEIEGCDWDEIRTNSRLLRALWRQYYAL